MSKNNRENYQRREPYSENPEDSEQPQQSLDTPPEVIEIPAVIEAPPVLVKAATTPPEPLPTLVHPHLKNTAMLAIQSDLVALAQALDPKKPVEPRWQYSLFQLFRNVIEKEDGTEFYKEWTAVLNFFQTSKGTAFSDMYMLRFSDDWPGSEVEFALFRRLVHIASATSDPQTRRKAAAAINMTRATEGLLEDARNRLIGYYG